MFERDADGSIIYDPSTEYNSESGAGRICQSDDCQAPNQPPYAPEYMAKVRKIAATNLEAPRPLIHCRIAGRSVCRVQELMESRSSRHLELRRFFTKLLLTQRSG